MQLVAQPAEAVVQWMLSQCTAFLPTKLYRLNGLRTDFMQWCVVKLMRTIQSYIL